MKTIERIFAALIFLSLSLPMNAQFSLGVKAGADIATVKGPDFLTGIEFIPNFQNVVNAQFGVVSEIELSPYFAFQPELVYTKKGFKLDESYDLNLFDIPVPIGATAITTFDYLQMPLLAKAKFGNDIVEGFVFAGPTLGYAIDGNITTRARVLIEFDLFDTDLDLDNLGYERFEVAGTVGGGIAFNTPGGKFMLDARYNHGFHRSI